MVNDVAPNCKGAQAEYISLMPGLWGSEAGVRDGRGYDGITQVDNVERSSQKLTEIKQDGLRIRDVEQRGPYSHRTSSERNRASDDANRTMSFRGTREA